MAQEEQTEFKLNVVPSPFDARDYIYSGTSNSRNLPKLAPEEYDMRPMLQPIRHQGLQGTCTGQSSACMKEWQERTQINLDFYLSPQFIYNHRENQDSEGMHLRDAMKVLNNIGVCLEMDYPYGTIQKKEEISQECNTKASNYKIVGYAQVNTIEDLKQALVNNGPCIIAFPVYNYGMQMWQKVNSSDPLLGGHAMCVVGYTKEGFIIRNSWGHTWGNQGYCIYPYSQFGSHWEIWTSVDGESVKPVPQPAVGPPTIFGIWFNPGQVIINMTSPPDMKYGASYIVNVGGIYKVIPAQFGMTTFVSLELPANMGQNVWVAVCTVNASRVMGAVKAYNFFTDNRPQNYNQ